MDYAKESLKIHEQWSGTNLENISAPPVLRDRTEAVRKTGVARI